MSEGMVKRLSLFLSVLVFSLSVFGQYPPIGMIDVYGLKSVSKGQVLAAAGIKPGDDALGIISSQSEIRQRLLGLATVEEAAVSLVCCADRDGKSMVFLGIRERGSSTLRFRRPPNGTARLPAEIVKAGEDFQTAFTRALEARDFSEDDTAGHALFGYAPVRAVQQRFIELATPNLNVLRRALRGSADSRQRALAAQVIAYARDKRSVVADLAFAMDDPDSETRNNAMRALLVIAKYARAHPKLRIKVPTLPFVRLLGSLVWTDRNKSAGALDTLTIGRDPALMAELRARSLDVLAEMARWTNPGHAQSSFNILARVAGLPETEIERVRVLPDRDRQVELLLQKARALQSSADQSR